MGNLLRSGQQGKDVIVANLLRKLGTDDLAVASKNHTGEK
jgi:hypothetical protein